MENSKIIENIENKSIKIAVIGIGRIGLPTALCIAKAGFETIGVDTVSNTHLTLPTSDLV